MDAYRRGDQFLVHLDLPGVNPDTIDVAVENQVLTVGGGGPAATTGSQRA